LILAGRPGFGFNEYEKKIKSLGDRVLIFNNVNDEKLLLLYNKALVFLFPSFVEGFGIPPLEAMACGRPVIASDCSALKEILKDSAILVPPDNVEQFLFELKRLLCDDKLYNHLAEKGFEILKNYSRENMIKSFLEVLKSIN
jgi:glycosyltransferase involved in cell wall biosynthesis